MAGNKVFSSIETVQPTALTVGQSADLGKFLLSIGMDPTAFIELRVWFEGSNPAAPRNGALTYAAAFVKDRSVDELPATGVFSCFAVKEK
jgi:hypothetical protein